MQHQINDSTSASATEWAAVCFRWHSMLWLSQKGVAVVGFNTLSLLFCSMYNQSFLATDIYYTVQGVLSNHFVCIMLFILLFFFFAIYRTIHNLFNVYIMSHICKWWKETMFTKVFVYVYLYILYNLQTHCIMSLVVKRFYIEINHNYVSLVLVLHTP